jgi:CRP/FNR family cyclic AMP-dependent transcriptional regulator
LITVWITGDLFLEVKMECICEKLSNGFIELSPTCLRHLWIFSDLEEDALKALSKSAIRNKISKGGSLFFQGDTAKKMFLIKGGRVKFSKIIEDGSEVTIDYRKAGDFVGENILTQDLIYPFSAWCMEDTITCGFSKNQFQEVVLKYPEIGLQMIKKMSERISWLTNQIGSVSVTNIEARLYQVLINVAREHGVRDQKNITIQFPLTHEDLGFLIGAHRG